MGCYVIGLDFGTNSARALLVDVATGHEVATSVHPYRGGDEGVLTDPSDALLARQDPREYIEALAALIPGLIAEARGKAGADPAGVIGIGIDTTASTPLPVDARGLCLTLDERFADNMNACAWLWKDHTAHREAEQIVETVTGKSLPYLRAYGGVYSSEWFWAKVCRCCRIDAEVAAAAATWDGAVRFYSRAPDRRRSSCGAETKRLRRRLQGDVRPRVWGFPARRIFHPFGRPLRPYPRYPA
jgi:L-ribulokinase